MYRQVSQIIFSLCPISLNIYVLAACPIQTVSLDPESARESTFVRIYIIAHLFTGDWLLDVLGCTSHGRRNALPIDRCQVRCSYPLLSISLSPPYHIFRDNEYSVLELLTIIQRFVFITYIRSQPHCAHSLFFQLLCVKNYIFIQKYLFGIWQT